MKKLLALLMASILMVSSVSVAVNAAPPAELFAGVIEELGITGAEAIQLYYQLEQEYKASTSDQEKIQIFNRMEPLVKAIEQHGLGSISSFNSIKAEHSQKFNNHAQSESYTGKPLAYLTGLISQYSFKYSNTSGGATLVVGGQAVEKDTAVLEADKNDIIALLDAALVNGCIDNATNNEKTTFKGQISILRASVMPLENSTEIVDKINQIMELNTMLSEIEAAESSEKRFSDVKKEDWFYEPVMVMASKNLINGKTEFVNGVGQFFPHDTITRAEYIAIIMRIMYPTWDFTADSGDAWWSEIYKTATSNGFVEDSDIDKSPELPITRDEMAYITYTAMVKKMGEPRFPSTRDDIPDFDEISNRYEHAVLVTHSRGIIRGYEDGCFKPNNNLTRAEASAVLHRLLNLLDLGVYYY